MRLARRQAALGSLSAAISLGFFNHVSALSDLDSSQTPIAIKYKLSAAGVKAAKMTYALEPKDGLLNSRLKIKSAGFIGTFRSFDTDVKGACLRLDDGGLRPVSFSISHKKGGSKRTVQLTYDELGEIAHLHIERNGEIKPSKVSAALQANTIDPLTAIIQVRTMIASNGWTPKDTALTPIHAFDGRKRYDIDLAWRGDLAGNASPLGTNARKFSILRTPIAGYDEDDAEWRRHLEGELKPLELWVTSDPLAIPYLAISSAGTVKREFKLEEVCVDGGCTKV